MAGGAAQVAISLLNYLLVPPLAAQSVYPKVASLVARTYRVDTKARSDLGTIARGMLVEVGLHRVNGPGVEAVRERRIAVRK